MIVLLHGHSHGLAIDLATAADIRLATRSATLSIAETSLGLAADVGTLQRMPRIGVPHSWLREVAYTSRVFGGAEALEKGFVSHAVEGGRAELVKKGLEIARGVVGNSPVAVQGTKGVLGFSGEVGVERGLEFVAAWNGGMLQTGDLTEGMRSRLKRKGRPRFEKL